MVGTLAFRALGDPRHLWPCRRNGFPSNLLSSSSGQVYRVFNEKAVPRWLFWIKGERWPGFNRLNGAKEEGGMGIHSWLSLLLAGENGDSWNKRDHRTFSSFLFLREARTFRIRVSFRFFSFFLFLSSPFFRSFRDNQPVQWRNFSLSHGCFFFLSIILKRRKLFKNSLSARSPPLLPFVILRNRSSRKRDTRRS